MKEKLVTKSIKIKPSIRKKAKMIAVELDMTFSEVIQKSLEWYLSLPTKQKSRNVKP